MTGWQVLAIPVDQALLVALSVGLAALIRAFTGFGFAMLAVPVFSLLLLPGDAVVLERSAGAHPRADELSVMVGLVSRDTSGTDGVGQFTGHRGRRLVFGLAVSDGVPALDWHFSRGGVFGVVAFYPSRKCRLWVHLTGYRRGLGINERRLCHSRTAGHFVCGRHHGESRALAGVSDDVLLVLQYCVARHVWHRGADYPQTFPVALGGAASHVVGESARQLGLRAIRRARLQAVCSRAVYCHRPVDFCEGTLLGLITA